MKKVLVIFVFIFVGLVYFAVATKFTFRPPFAIDYFNQIAHSLLAGRLDIQSPGETHDLVFFREKWYTVWGILPALFLIPAQILKGRFVPPVYLSLLFGSLNVVLMYLLLVRIKKEFFPRMADSAIYILTAFFAFGTTQFYVATLGSVWHVSQIVSSFFGNLGIYIIFRKNRSVLNYLFASLAICVSFLGRVTTVFLIMLPAFLLLWDKRTQFVKGLAAIAVPFILFLTFFLGFNVVRFGSPFEFGYSYIVEEPYLADIRLKNGASSIKNISNNLRYMVLEIPGIQLRPRPELHPNLLGNSIFFLSLPLLYIFLASPWKKKKKWLFDPYVGSIWATVLFALIPALLHYSTGWMQFGYRYTLDVTMLLILLTVFATKGKLNLFYNLGVIFSVIMYTWGILLML